MSFMTFDDIWWQFVFVFGTWGSPKPGIPDRWDFASFALPWPRRPGMSHHRPCEAFSNEGSRGFPKMGDPDTIQRYPNYRSSQNEEIHGFGVPNLYQSLEPPICPERCWDQGHSPGPTAGCPHDCRSLSSSTPMTWMTWHWRISEHVFPTCLHKFARMRPDIRIEDDLTYWICKCICISYRQDFQDVLWCIHSVHWQHHETIPPGWTGTTSSSRARRDGTCSMGSAKTKIFDQERGFKLFNTV